MKLPILKGKLEFQLRFPDVRGGVGIDQSGLILAARYFQGAGVIAQLLQPGRGDFLFILQRHVAFHNSQFLLAHGFVRFSHRGSILEYGGVMENPTTLPVFICTSTLTYP